MTTEPALDAGIEARAFADRVDGVLEAFLAGVRAGHGGGGRRRSHHGR